MKQYKSVIPKPFAPLCNPKVRKVIEESGRSSGKSTTNETVAIGLMMKSRKNNIWYCRAEKGDVRISVFNSFLATLSAMGVEQYFDAKLNPMEITCLLTGAKCYFGGINGKTKDDLNATKGFVPQDRSLAMFIVDEANEVKSYQHIRAAETTANKFLQQDGKIIYAYNPPPNLGHWAHSFFARQVEQGATKIYTTYKDIYKLLNPATIEEIETMKRENPRQFAYWYLGQKISLEGLVLYTFNDEKNLIDIEKFKAAVAKGYQPLYVIYGVDSGVVKDPTAVCPLGVFPDGNLIQLSTLYIDPRKEGEPIPNSMQVEQMRKWYDDFYRQMREIGVILPTAFNEAWVFDSAVVTQDLMFEWQTKTGFYCKAVENKAIERDIKRLQNCCHRGIYKVLNTPENAPTLREIKTFCYDENNEIPDGQDDHTIDALKYATAHYYYSYMSNFG